MSKARRRVQKNFTDKSRTHQSFADECNINMILKKHRAVGFVENVTLSRPVYGDFTNTADYQTNANKLIAAEELFYSLPARIRARVDNDPAKLIDFVADPNNDEELRELGLKDPIVEHTEVPLDSPPAVEEKTPTT